MSLSLGGGLCSSLALYSVVSAIKEQASRKLLRPDHVIRRCLTPDGSYSDVLRA